MLVKKYGNRRLYDTEESRYLTLAELAEKVRRGADLRVVDAKSGADLTQATLAQIILEGRGAAQLLPVPLLQQLVRLEDDVLAEFLGRYLAYALELYLQARQGASALNPLALFPFASANPFARFFPGPAPVTGGAPPASPPASSELDGLRRELDALKRKVFRKRRRRSP